MYQPNAGRWEPRERKYTGDWKPWDEDGSGTPSESEIERGTIEMVGVGFTTAQPKQNGCLKLNASTRARIEACESQSQFSQYS